MEHNFFDKKLGHVSDEELMKSLRAANEKTKTPRSPYVGEIVLFKSNPDDTIAKSNNHPGPIPAIVTRVWSHGCVNCKIIPDCGAMQDRTSVVHHSLNPAGYHFLFLDEVVNGNDLSEVNKSDSEVKNASSFLSDRETEAIKKHISLNTPMSI